MPAWGTHLATVKEILNSIEIENKNDFIFGNILPDIQNGYVIQGVSKIVSHKISHFDDFPKGVYKCHKKFYEVYGDSIYKDTMKLAYYTHLLTDDIWNREFYENKVIFSNGKPAGIKLHDGSIIKSEHENIRELKHTIFNDYSKYLIIDNKTITPEFDKTLITKANSLDIVNINTNDLKKVFQYFELQKAIIKSLKVDIDLRFFSIEEAENIFHKCVNEIIKDLKGNLKK